MSGSGANNGTLYTGIDSVLCASLNCKGCNRSDDEEPMISCEKCNIRWHSSCAGILPELAHDRPWRCNSCPIGPTFCESISSVKTTMSAQLRLKQLEERKALEDKLLEERARKDREFLAEKQQLEAEAEAEKEGCSIRSFKSRRSDIQSWLNKQHPFPTNPESVVTCTSTPVASSLPDTSNSASKVQSVYSSTSPTRPIYSFAANPVPSLVTKAVVSQHLSTQMEQAQNSQHSSGKTAQAQTSQHFSRQIAQTQTSQNPQLSISLVHGQLGPQPSQNIPLDLSKPMQIPSKPMGTMHPSLYANLGLSDGCPPVMPPVTTIAAAAVSESTRLELLTTTASCLKNSIQHPSVQTQPLTESFSWGDISRDLHSSTQLMLARRNPPSGPLSRENVTEQPGPMNEARAVALQSGRHIVPPSSMTCGIHDTMQSHALPLKGALQPARSIDKQMLVQSSPVTATNVNVTNTMQPGLLSSTSHQNLFTTHVVMQQPAVTSGTHGGLQSFTRHYPGPSDAQVTSQSSLVGHTSQPSASGVTHFPKVQQQPSTLPPNASYYYPWSQQPTMTNPIGASNTVWPVEGIITPQQFAARHVVSRDLPKFSGDPLEWPMFLSSFESTTVMCGMQPDENLARLQKCLVGSAREKVQSLLTLPSAIPEIINTLRDECGRPEQLVHCLLAKVRNTPLPDVRKLETLVAFGREVKNLVTYIEASNLHAHLSNPLLLAELINRLPTNLRLDWGLYSQRIPEITLKAFSDFALIIKTAACQVNTPTDYILTEHSTRRAPKKEKGGFVNAHSVEDPCETSLKLERPKYDISNKDPNIVHHTKQNSHPKPCHMCQRDDHKVRDCKNFLKLPVYERVKFIKEHNLCGRCLTGHGKWPCRTKQPCGVNECKEMHHKLLHLKPENPRGAILPAIISTHSQQQTSSLFKIVPVTLRNKGKSVDTFAFLDDGSDLTLLDDGLADELGHVGIESPLCLQWTSNVTRHESSSKLVQLKISGSDGKTDYFLKNVRTVKNLGLPKQNLNYENLANQFPFLRGLPIKSYSQANPGILIGVDNAWLKLPLKKRDRRETEPVAIKTRLGWIIFGGQYGSTGPQRCMVHTCSCIGDRELHSLVKDYFAAEDTGIDRNHPTESTEDRRALKILEETTKRTESGHFETGMLWAKDDVKFPNSYPMAERRLRCLERRLSADPVLRETVREQIVEYQRLGYAHKATTEELRDSECQKVWYLPLGVVRNPKKPKKVRVVWDAAATVGGVSLNSVLLKGPDLTTPLLTVLCRFRQRQFAVAGDIRQMFHQLLIRKEDRQSQRFLWREDPNSAPEVFVMDVVTFGATCSPCSAQYAKNKNAREYSGQYPTAAAAIIENTYVDDYLDSRDTIHQMVQIANEVSLINRKAGFELRNWQSNSEHVLSRVGESSSETVKNFSLEKLTVTERVLGMMWIPKEDIFVFSSQFRADLVPLLSGDIVPTKRQVLQVVMSLFDPLGIIANYTIHGKILIQDIWRSGIDWDDKLTEKDFSSWQRWVQLLPQLDGVRIPRCYFPNYKPQSYDSLQLHIFVDASELAYCCVAYFRIVDNGSPRCVLVSAKAKVTPTRPRTIPRNELNAASIGVRLLKAITQNHSLPIKKRFLWTDSRTVLSWIRADPRKFRQFVAFRVAEILDETEYSEWNWVPTKINIADEATKWGTGPTFDSDSPWFRGPDFLYLSESQWPTVKPVLADPVEELRAVHVHRAASIETVFEFSKFSCLKHLLKKLAYIYHFINKCRKSFKSKSLTLSQQDYFAAENSLWRMVQAEAFPDELSVLNANLDLTVGQRKSIDKSSSLRKVSPFLDENGVMRSESRIDPQAAYYCYDFRNPIILPKRNHVTELLILRLHQQYGHANHETVINEMQQKYYIAKLRSEVKRVVKSCMWCRVYRAKPSEPRMAPLPQERVQPYICPFTFTGVDYFGPLIVKIGRSNAKRWVALFTCLTVRAVHLEVVHSLSAESCKMAIRRFVARRGSPRQFFSDNGTNFRGVAKELADEVRSINRQIAGAFINAGTDWHFIPPSAPHMGGVWERKVRSVKEAFKVLSHREKLNDEGLVTLLTEAELIVNSHPLTCVPLETLGQKYLTPNCFLLMNSSAVNNSDKVPLADTLNLRTNWKLMQHLLNQFWKHWITSYLPTIAKRTKWFSEVPPINEGDLVVVVDESVRNGWLRGRVIKAYKGIDNQVRKVDVQTSSGILQRPATKVAVLDVLELSKTN